MHFEFILLLLALVLVLLKVGWALFIIVISAALNNLSVGAVVGAVVGTVVLCR